MMSNRHGNFTTNSSHSMLLPPVLKTHCYAIVCRYPQFLFYEHPGPDVAYQYRL